MKTNPSLPFAAVIFDLDGTLVDSLHDIASTMNGVLEELGFPVRAIPDYRYFVGSGVRALVEKVAFPNTTPEDLDRIERTYRKLYATKTVASTRPYEGILDLLHSLHANGIRLAVLTNKPQGPTESLLKEVLPNTPFELIIGHRDGYAAKPDPNGALEIAERMRLDPQAFLYVGDTNVDMLTAERAGMPSCGVTWGFRDRDELEEARATYIVDHPSRIAELVLGARA